MSTRFYYWFCFLLLLEAVVGNPIGSLSQQLDQKQLQELWVAEAEVPAMAVRHRARRQVYGADLGAQVINDIFQIPIQTLTAVSNLFRSTRASRNQRRRTSNSNNSNNNNSNNSNNNNDNNSNYYDSPNKYSGYNSGYTAYNKPSAYYTTDSNGQNNGYSDAVSRPNRYTSVNGYNRPNNYFYQNSDAHRYSRYSHAASVARLSVAKDGSSFKI